MWLNEKIQLVQTTIEEILRKHEVPYRSVRVANYRQASYFVFKGSWVVVGIDSMMDEFPTIAFVGETTNMSRYLSKCARSLNFSHAYIIDMGEEDRDTRERVKNLLCQEMRPIFKHLSAFIRARERYYYRSFDTKEVVDWQIRTYA